MAILFLLKWWQHPADFMPIYVLNFVKMSEVLNWHCQFLGHFLIMWQLPKSPKTSDNGRSQALHFFEINLFCWQLYLFKFCQSNRRKRGLQLASTSFSYKWLYTNATKRCLVLLLLKAFLKLFYYLLLNFLIAARILKRQTNQTGAETPV